MKFTTSACIAAAVLVAGTSHVAVVTRLTRHAFEISGSTALALAGVIAPLSPILSGAEKKAVAMLFAANADIPYKKPIVVTADRSSAAPAMSTSPCATARSLSARRSRL